MYWRFKEQFTDKAQILFDLLFTKQFSADTLRKRLEGGEFCANDVDCAAYAYMDACGDLWEVEEKRLYEGRAFGETMPGLESSHFAEAIIILLEFGLNPNRIFSFDDGSQTNIMEDMWVVRNGYQAADAAIAMLEHGGNPNLKVHDGEDLFASLCFEMLFNLRGDEENRYYADGVVHYWMPFVGFGAKDLEGGEAVQTFDHFDVSGLRNHRQYYYGFIHTEDGSAVSFFDKDTNQEVARY